MVFDWYRVPRGFLVALLLRIIDWMKRLVPSTHSRGAPRDASQWVVFDSAGDVIAEPGSDRPFLSNARVSELAIPLESAVFVGMFGGTECFGVHLTDAHPLDGVELEHRSLRELLAALPDVDAGALSRARQVLHWDRTHRFCGCCGTVLEDKTDECAKECPSCGHCAYPRLNPAIIVAIRRAGKLLLARNKRYRRHRMFSLIAGFVEAGESLEATVEREVMEEVGLRIGDIRYFGSQPWPFPSTLMLGFTAEYVSGEISLADGELVEADWFSADSFPELPPFGSISRVLIEDFRVQSRVAPFPTVP